MENLALGIDIGTSACKVAVFATDGRVLAQANRSYPIAYGAHGSVTQNADDWWEAVCDATKQILQTVKAADICAIGIDGQSWSAICMDEQGNTLAPNPIWQDTSAAQVCREYEERLSPEAIFAVSANPFSPSYTLPKILYWQRHQPALLQRTRYILQSNAFIAYRLSGVVSQDLSQSYGYANYDLKNKRYDPTLTKEFGIDPRFFIDPVACDCVIGGVTAQAAAQCGLQQGTPVVAGGLDAACGTLGAGVIAEGQAQEQGGQSGGMSICTRRFLPHPKLIFGAHVIADYYLLQGGTIGGGASLKWFAQELCGNTPEPNRFARLSAQAEQSPPGAKGLIYLPYMNGERSPLWDIDAQGVYFGVGFDKTHADMVRATMEGVAFSLQHNLETAKEVGAEVSELRAMGGSANSHIWTQIKADVTGKPMVIPASDTATTCGAAMLGMVGVGIFANYRDATNNMVKIMRTQTPDLQNHALYAPYYALYRSLYPCLAEHMRSLAKLNHTPK